MTDGVDEALRELGRQCDAAGASAWLYAELDGAARSGGAYRPLRDRSEHDATALAAWKQARGSLPALMPGELLRL